MTEVKGIGLTRESADLLSEELSKVEQKDKGFPKFTLEQVYTILYKNKDMFRGCVVTENTDSSFLKMTTIYVQKTI